MAEGEIAQPPPTNADGGNGANHSKNDESKQHPRGRRSRHRPNNRNKWKEGATKASPNHIPKEKFVGRSDDLKGFIYDIALSKGGVAYTRTTEEIARYVGEKYTTTGSYIRTALLTLNVPSLARPIAPVATGTPPAVSAVDQEIFK
jgi:hypothetical protein